MINKHITFFPNKFKKLINCLDLTFGNGGYNYEENYLISVEKNYSLVKLSKKKFKKKFFIFCVEIKKVFLILKRFNFDKINIIIYDQGFNTCEIKNYFYKLKKNIYINIKKKINKNLINIFYKNILFFKKNFLIIYNVFDVYEFFKIIFFLKKINKFKFKLIKMNYFEKSLNNSIKHSIMLIIYV